MFVGGFQIWVVVVMATATSTLLFKAWGFETKPLWPMLVAAWIVFLGGVVFICSILSFLTMRSECAEEKE